MGGCATKENKENKPAEEADGCVFESRHLFLYVYVSIYFTFFNKYKIII